MAGTTYQDLNNLLSNIRESGYLEGRWTTEQSPAGGNTDYDQEVEQQEDEEEEEEVVADNGTEANGHHNESNKKMLGQNSMNEPDEPTAVFSKSVSGTTETVPAPAPAPVKQEPSFNFLQESQIDLESPHMDPAVVMVHPAKRPVQPPGNLSTKYFPKCY